MLRYLFVCVHFIKIIISKWNRKSLLYVEYNIGLKILFAAGVNLMDYKNFRLTLICVCLLSLAIGVLASGSVQATARPGSAEDPLVTQHWLEEYLSQQLAPLENRLNILANLADGGEGMIILQIGSNRAIVNGQAVLLDAAPQIRGAGYTMVPIRFIGEALGVTFDWNPTTRVVSFYGNGNEMFLSIGNTTATINGQATPMPFAPIIENDRTLVHVRFIGEAFQATVDWLPHTRTVIVQQ